MNDHLKLLKTIRSADPKSPVPTQEQLTLHLQDRIAAIGGPAFAEFAFLQKVAAETWGAERTAHFAGVLRRARVTAKTPRKSSWTLAEDLVGRLPHAWQPMISEQIEISKSRQRVKGRRIWSAAHTKSVLRALIRWSDHCESRDLVLLPTGTTLDGFGQVVAARTTSRTASDYIGRILSGLTVVAPDFDSMACEFVAVDWKERAVAQGPTTKSGAQLVGASRIYDLGFMTMENARARKVRGLHAAKEFRNGILLALAAALPQRARALSSLEFGRTLDLLGGPAIHIRIPAHMLKLPEDRKAGEPFECTLTSEKLAAALHEYRAGYRPLFDDGTCLFPSMLARGRAISERQIGLLVGNMTEKAFKVRVSIHRVRDNVATESSELLSGGGRAASALLGHKDLKTTQRYYDHSTGLAAAQEFLQLVESQRRMSCDLAL